MRLIIAEKPELAKDISKAILGHTNKNNGYYSANGIIVVSAFGHLLTLAEPEEYNIKYKQWILDDLPIYFESWRLVPAKEDYKIRQLKLIGELLEKTDEVVHAGDPDEEGQFLIDEIIEYYNFSGKVYRVYINDNLEKNIINAFNHLTENGVKERSLGKSAYARTMADKCFGINETRLAALKLNTFGKSIGRVQTPTLGLVVTRDEAIKNHIKEKYYELYAKITLKNNENEYEDVPFRFKPSNLLLEGQRLIQDKSVLEEVKRLIQSDLKTCFSEIQRKTVAPLLPFNLTKLQSYANRKLGYSLQKTLDITQSLRDKHKAITYNRSDSEYLSEEHYKEAVNVIPTIQKNLNSDYPLDYKIKSRCFDKSKVTAHHAIIPQDIDLDLSKFTDEERKIYKLISERYIMQFLPHKELETSISKISIENSELNLGFLEYRSTKILSKGFSQYFEVSESEEDKDNDGDVFIDEGEYNSLFLDCNVIEKETRPLKRYTPGTLNADMASIAKYVTDPEVKKILLEKDKGKTGEKGSIGTVATRSTIIENLIRKGFLEMEGSNIISTPMAREFFNMLPRSIKTADLTAKWWLIQEQIKTGEVNENTLLKTIIDDFNSHKDTSYKDVNGLKSEIQSTTRKELCQCFLCGGSIYKSMKSDTWYCSNYENGCNLRIYGNMKYFNNNLTITDKKAIELASGKTALFTLLSKKNEKYKAYLKIKMNGKYTNFELDRYYK